MAQRSSSSISAGATRWAGSKSTRLSRQYRAGVAEFQVALAQLLEDILRAADICVIVRRTGPQAQHICAEFLDDLVGVHAVAQGLVHGAAFAVDGPAVGQALFEGRALAQGADGGQQAGLEPAAVLVGAFQIYMSAGQKPWSSCMEATWEEPESNQPSSVSVSFSKFYAAAVGAGEAFGQNLRFVQLKPGVAALGARTARRWRRCFRRCRWACRSPCNRTTGMGRPQRRWREMHQSARSRIMAIMRSLPQAGSPADVVAGFDGVVLEGIRRSRTTGGWRGR